MRSRDRRSLPRPADFTDVFISASQDAYPSMVRYARSIAGPAHGEDVAQEALLKAWRYLGSFKGEGSIEGWLFKICRRCALDFSERDRSPTRDWGPASDDGEVPTLATHDGPATDLELMIGDLGPEEREAFALTQLAGLTYAETADALGIPVGTVRSRVARARRILIDGIRSAEAS